MSTVAYLPGCDPASGSPAGRVGPRPPAPAASAAPSSRVALRSWTRRDVEAARAFLLELDGHLQGADLPRLAYLTGLLEGHALTLLDVIDAVTEVS
jgi:hypothetical protein